MCWNIEVTSPEGHVCRILLLIFCMYTMCPGAVHYRSGVVDTIMVVFF